MPSVTSNMNMCFLLIYGEQYVPLSHAYWPLSSFDFRVRQERCYVSLNENVSYFSAKWAQKCRIFNSTITMKSIIHHAKHTACYVQFQHFERSLMFIAQTNWDKMSQIMNLKAINRYFYTVISPWFMLGPYYLIRKLRYVPKFTATLRSPPSECDASAPCSNIYCKTIKSKLPSAKPLTKQKTRLSSVITARCYAERGYEIACRLSVRPWRWGHDFHTGWNTSKIISRPNSLRPLLWLTLNMGDLVQREHPQN